MQGKLIVEEVLKKLHYLSEKSNKLYTSKSSGQLQARIVEWVGGQTMANSSKEIHTDLWQTIHDLEKICIQSLFLC